MIRRATAVAEKPITKKIVRCAIYTRKSTDEGLDREFNSLDAQRDAGEAYARSQQHEGWTVSPKRYDDGGVSGGTTDRPALQELLTDVRTGLIDVVVVYKVDRFSRSLLDFGRLMELFDQHQVALVSVTQQFNTGSSMGRLTLNLLLTFAQFEREMISERTRDKMAATRRKGRRCGGRPILGYDVDPVTKQLVIHPIEAEQVRAIFTLYLELGGLLAVVSELARRGWTNKRFSTRDGRPRGGVSFNKATLYYLLRNVAYVGQVAYKQEIHPGVHEPIVDRAVWDRVQRHLAANGRDGGARVRNPSGALLKGLAFCSACGKALTPTHTTKNGCVRYCYYACLTTQQRGRRACPTRPVRAEALESFVLDRIRAIGANPQLQREVAERIETERDAQLNDLASEARVLTRDVARSQSNAVNATSVAETRLHDVEELIEALEQVEISGNDVALMLTQFDELWSTLQTRERTRLVQLLIHRVDYDAVDGKIAVTFQPLGVELLHPAPTQETQG